MNHLYSLPLFSVTNGIRWSLKKGKSHKRGYPPHFWACWMHQFRFSKKAQNGMRWDMKEIYLGVNLCEEWRKTEQEKAGKASRPWYRIEPCEGKARKKGIGQEELQTAVPFSKDSSRLKEESKKYTVKGGLWWAGMTGMTLKALPCPKHGITPNSQ